MRSIETRLNKIEETLQPAKPPFFAVWDDAGQEVWTVGELEYINRGSVEAAYPGYEITYIVLSYEDQPAA